MIIIAGLGNPGREYENTRHNVGFEVVDALARKIGATAFGKEGKALVAKGIIAGEKVLLVKPQTYMNLSGEAIRPLLDFYKLDPEESLIVISDDIDLPVGHIRIRQGGSAGGHNGLKNIILHTGTEKFPRLRLGVGQKPDGYDLADYVLGHFSGEEKTLMEEKFGEAADAVALMIEEDVSLAMNRYNTKKEKKPKKTDENTDSTAP
ncbi:MAG: aminoacyl-tRNA hydrolase [Lachnospiraceae bacterium]|nr:aminoacyl-tRNA hydrolase [Lachnospiraceae bacterium]